jgi:serine protease Do
LGRREEAEGAVAAAEPTKPVTPSKLSVLGLTLSPVTEAMREQFELDESTAGLAVVDIDEASEAFEKGLRQGDVITEAGQNPIVSTKDLEDRIAEARDEGRKSLLLLIRRGGDPRFVALGLEDK